MDATIHYDWLRIVNYIIYVNVAINKICMGHVTKWLDHVSMASGCDCEQNHMYIVCDTVA